MQNTDVQQDGHQVEECAVLDSDALAQYESGEQTALAARYPGAMVLDVTMHVADAPVWFLGGACDKPLDGIEEFIEADGVAMQILENADAYADVKFLVTFVYNDDPTIAA